MNTTLIIRIIINILELVTMILYMPLVAIIVCVRIKTFKLTGLLSVHHAEHMHALMLPLPTGTVRIKRVDYNNTIANYACRASILHLLAPALAPT